MDVKFSHSTAPQQVEVPELTPAKLNEFAGSQAQVDLDNITLWRSPVEFPDARPGFDLLCNKVFIACYNSIQIYYLKAKLYCLLFCIIELCAFIIIISHLWRFYESSFFIHLY